MSNELSKTQKDDAEALLNMLLPFAKQLLEKNGEFFPFGAAMQPDGSITAVAFYDGEEHPAAQQVIDALLAGFRARATLGAYRAVGIAYEVTMVAPGESEKTDAIAVRLDHVTGSSIVVIFPCRIARGGEVVIANADSFATPGPGDVFSIE